MMIRRVRSRHFLLRAVLGLSLALNVFFAAYLLTQFVHSQSSASVADGPPSVIMRAAERLPEAEAAILWRAYRAREDKVLAAQQDYRRALRDTALLLREPQVDAGRLRTAMDNAKDKRGAVGDLVLDIFLEAFPQMPLQAREGLLDKSQR